jgi:hypothetical protein
MVGFGEGIERPFGLDISFLFGSRVGNWDWKERGKIGGWRT